MSSRSRQGVERMERVGEIRAAFTRVAESAWMEAELRLREAAQAVADNDLRIKTVMNETAFATQTSAPELQNRERYLARLREHGHSLQQAVADAREAAATRQGEWQEARREEKIIENVHARRLKAWQHETDVEEQKNADELTTARFVRSRLQAAR